LTKGLRLNKNIGVFDFQDPIIETDSELHTKYLELKMLSSLLQNFDASAFEDGKKVGLKSY